MESHTMQIELTHRLLHDFLNDKSGRALTLRAVARPLMEMNPEMLEGSLTSQLFTAVRIL